MKLYSDGITDRALTYMGYSRTDQKMFKARAYDSDIRDLIEDAVAAGFDLETAQRFEMEVEFSRNQTNSGDNENVGSKERTEE